MNIHSFIHFIFDFSEYLIRALPRIHPYDPLHKITREITMLLQNSNLKRVRFFSGAILVNSFNTPDDDDDQIDVWISLTENKEYEYD